MSEGLGELSLRFMLRHPVKFTLWYFEGMLFRITEAE